MHSDDTSELSKADAQKDVAPPKEGDGDQSEVSKAKFDQFMSWLEYEQDAQSENRHEMAIDEGFYDGKQLTAEHKRILKQRGQADIVINKIFPACNWLIGTQKRTRVDYKIQPREESDIQEAEVKTKLLKYIRDVNRLGFERSHAFEECVIAGVGWLEDGIDTDPSQELIYSKAETWRNIYYDSHSKAKDLSDARYLFRSRWIDYDAVIELFPDSKHVLNVGENRDLDDESDTSFELGVNSEETGYFGEGYDSSYNNSWDNGRKRIRLIECWYRVSKRCEVCKGKPNHKYSGLEYDKTDQDMVAEVKSRNIQVVTAVKQQMRVAIMTSSVLLLDAKSPYRHNDFPFTPIWAFRRREDNAPYSVIRTIRGLQEDLNKRASKALHMINTSQISMTSDATNDVEYLRQQAARPDGVLIRKPGSSLEKIDGAALVGPQLELMRFDAQQIQDISGITDENMGRMSNATSGKAIEARQTQGAVVTTGLFDNYRFAIQLQGEKQLSLLEQFYSDEKVVRIVGEGKPIQWLRINQYDETTGQYINDITRTKADFVITEQDFKETYRQAASEQLMQMLAQVSNVNPQLAFSLLDMVVDLWDIPNKDEWLTRIRKLNGQRDPSKEETPEQQQQQQQQDQEQQMQAQMQQAQMQLALEKMKAEIDKLNADAGKISAQATAEMVKAIYSAMQAGQVAASAPQITPIADTLLSSAGFEDKAQNTQPPPAQMQQQDMGAANEQQAPLAPDSPASGVNRGIETNRNDGSMQ